ncbi:hypothetical protein MKC39_17535 [[Clostridium] innocuum]|uniref:hypothetical protein n=1 Tax=Clostridium innocuum TaxID=1522 RepID=UPI002148FBEA|nr:hypothetical protein [[Clostridium] innocuum]MCR0481892.1 hypothetical protein [[Clostridium] innocuum]MCR0649576.1 hypothetical protein [[Clostridium] innocuum]
MKHYKEQCCNCGKWTYDYDTSTGKILCESCLQETGGKLELDEPVQLTIDAFLYPDTEGSDNLLDAGIDVRREHFISKNYKRVEVSSREEAA